MSRPRLAECPQCLHQFPVARDEGSETQCPKCEFGLFVEWTDNEDGESVRLVLPEIIFVPPSPPTSKPHVLVASMTALEHAILSQVGIPASALTEDQNLRFIQQNTMFDLSCTMLERMLRTVSIRTQADYMDMRIVNNRKRMRKRVRQRRRRWTILDEHWTNNPAGDW